jgi:hypothetical protein
MPLDTELFQLIREYKYQEACDLLPRLSAVAINNLNHRGYSLLMAALEHQSGMPPERYTFIEQLLARPDFQHVNIPENGVTLSPFDSAIHQEDPFLVDLFLKYKDSKGIEVIFDGEELFYEQLAQDIQWTEELIKKEPESESYACLDEKRLILDTLFRVAVHHAIATDDDSILERLKKAGAKRFFQLTDRTFPRDIACDQGKTKTLKWLNDWGTQDYKRICLEAEEIGRQCQEESSARLKAFKQERMVPFCELMLETTQFILAKQGFYSASRPPVLPSEFIDEVNAEAQRDNQSNSI